MASSGWPARTRTRYSALLLGLLAVCAACTTTPTEESGAQPGPTSGVEPEPPAFEAAVELPAGRGRELLLTECLGCHDLAALPLFAPFYTRESWRTLVLTMQQHGAEIDGAEIEMLADYLAQHFGPDAP